MRRIAPILIVLVLGGPAPARADHEIGLFFGVMGGSALVPLGVAALVGPLYLAELAYHQPIVPRPTAGTVGLDLTPPLDSLVLGLVTTDWGGYVGKSGLGWESRGALMGFTNDAMDLVSFRWDGLMLFDMMGRRSPTSLEFLIGGTIWPAFGYPVDFGWSGGPATGGRLGYGIGPDRVVRLEGEALLRLLFSEYWEGPARQLEVRVSATVHIPYAPMLEGGPPRELGLGVTWLLLSPDRLDRLTPPLSAFLLAFGF